MPARLCFPMVLLFAAGFLGRWGGEAAAAEPVVLSAAEDRVGRYQRLEFSIEAPTDYDNPFDPDEVALALELTDPDGQRVTVPAFFCQPFERRQVGPRAWMYPTGTGSWRARFAPSVVGAYTARAVLVDRQGTRRSEPVAFECLPSDSSGYVRVSRGDPRFFETSDGEPFFVVGQNLAFIAEGQFATLARTEEVFGRLAENGANWVRVWAGCHDWAMGIEARKSAFGRSWHWRPPFGPHPDDGERLCVRLAGEAGLSVEVNPSHRVALRPNTRYVFSGRVLCEEGGAFSAETGGRQLPAPIEGRPGAWAEWKIEFETRGDEHWLGPTVLQLTRPGTVWVDRLSLTEAGGGPELLWEADPNRPARGVYNQIDCFMLDEVLAAAEEHGIRIQLTLLTRDLYMDDLEDENDEKYQEAIDDAKKILRYAVARWGGSTSVAVWEYFNEMNPGRPTNRFYRELGAYLDEIDPYRHLRSTSTWHPSPRDWELPYLDFADEHYYLRPSSYEQLRDEVDAVIDRVALLRRHAPQRPALLGEFGLADEQWRVTDRMRQQAAEMVETAFHNSLWSSALSGASGTAMWWWWETLDPVDHYRHYRPLADFLDGVPWTSGELHAAQAAVQPAGDENSDATDVLLVGLATGERAYLWLFSPQASWRRAVVEEHVPEPIRGQELFVEGLAEGEYRASWWDTRQGDVLQEVRLRAEGARLRLAVPDFERDVACRIEPW